MTATAPVPSIKSRAERLRKAVLLVEQGRVKHLRASQYFIQSGDDGYYVDLSENQTCYCKDRENRALEECKHSLSARLLRADPVVTKAITEFVAVMVER